MLLGPLAAAMPANLAITPRLLLLSKQIRNFTPFIHILLRLLKAENFFLSKANIHFSAN